MRSSGGLYLPLVVGLLAFPWIVCGLTILLYPLCERAFERLLYHRTVRALLRRLGGKGAVARHYQRLLVRIGRLERRIGA